MLLVHHAWAVAGTEKQTSIFIIHFIHQNSCFLLTLHVYVTLWNEQNKAGKNRTWQQNYAWLLNLYRYSNIKYTMYCHILCSTIVLMATVGYMTTCCDQLVAWHVVANNSLRDNSLQRLLVAATTRCVTSCCETTHCSKSSLQRQLVVTTGCDDEPLQLSVPFSFWTILSPPTLAGHGEIIAFNRQDFSLQF